MRVSLAAFAFEAVEEVAGVELDARLAGLHREDAAAGGLGDDRGDANLAIAAILHNEVVIVAHAIFKLLVFLINALPDAGGLGEIKRRSFDGRYPGWDRRGIDGIVALCFDLEMVIEDRLTPLSREIEVTVVGEIENRRLISGRLVTNPQRILLGPSVSHGAFEGAGVTFFAIGAGIGERETGVAPLIADLGLPNLLIESFDATVKGVGSVVDRETVFLAIEGELSFRNTVGVASGDTAEVGALFEVFSNRIKTENDVPHFAVLIGHDERGHGAAIVCDGDFCSGFVGKSVKLNRLPIDLAEGLGADRKLGSRSGEWKEGRKGEELFIH